MDDFFMIDDQGNVLEIFRENLINEFLETNKT